MMGFCRTNLFKRLESSGEAFLLSIERHIVRNTIFQYALQNDLALPIGTQEAALLDSNFSDDDLDLFDTDGNANEEQSNPIETRRLLTEADFLGQAKHIYELYVERYKRKFRWLPANRFLPALKDDLENDAKSLIKLLKEHADWNPSHDSKLNGPYTICSPNVIGRTKYSCLRSLQIPPPIWRTI